MPSDDLTRARADLDEARRRRAALVAEAAAAAKHLAAAEADHGRDDERATAARAHAEEITKALAEAHSSERRAAGVVEEHLGAWLEAEQDDAAALDAGHPVVLLPVRLETRFVREGEVRSRRREPHAGTLLVRIYPDDVHADSHEPSLTVEERAAGEAYWRAAWAADEAGDRNAWRMLVANMSAARAAWVVDQLTPTNLAARPGGDPAFPVVAERPASWTEAVEARCLPDRFLVLAYRGGVEVKRATTGPLQVPLALSVSPSADPKATTAIDGTGPKLDEQVRWTMEFGRAVDAGMAVRIPLDAADLDGGFDRLLVVGVASSLDPDAAAGALAGLFASHHYSRGLALVRQGTPTNNSEASASGFPPADPDGAVSYAVERGDPLTEPGTDGLALADALGIAPSVLAHVEGAGRTEQRNAKAMAVALWPATLGYYLEHLMAPEFDDEAIASARSHFVDHVRGRGPLPSIRVGLTPYGLLPVTSLARMKTGGDDPVDRVLPEALRRLLPVWRAAVPNAPHLGRTTDPDADLLEVLGMDAAAQEVRVRRLTGEEFERNLRNLLFLGLFEWFNPARVATRQLLTDLGVGHWSPRVAFATFAANARRFAGSLVCPEPLSETATLKDNYIRELRELPFVHLRVLRLLEEKKRPPLLHLLLRAGALTEMRSAMYDHLVAAGVVTKLERRERELVGIGASGKAAPTMWDHLDRLSEGRQVSLRTAGSTATAASARTRAFTDGLLPRYDAALAVLQDLPTAELERLLTENLDVASHRIDAWVTSLATKRLASLRGDGRTGCHLGAYGWVEDLRPDPPEGRSTENGGYVHAPSMAHAATAALLRNAWLTHRDGPDRQRYAVDLSSARVRDAQHLLDAVRNGQPLGAVLGYRFERGLHEGHRPLSLDKYIEPLRRLYPLVSSRLPESEEAGEAIAARDVVHGLRLRAAFVDGTVPFGREGLPTAGTPEHEAIVAELRALDDAVDATADLVLAEGVHQLVRGAVDASAGTFDALTGEGRPPEPHVATMPRSGAGFTHRVAVVVGDGGPALPGGWPAQATPRAEAEPALDRWVGSLLGSPTNVRCRANWRTPTAANPDARTERVVSLDELGLRPLDVLALAQEAGTALDRLVAWTVTAGAPEPSDVRIVYARDAGADPTTERTFPEVLELARLVAEVVGGARPLVPDHLVVPGASVSGEDLLAADALVRATAARDGLAAARGALEVARVAAAAPAAPTGATMDALRAALLEAAAFGLADAVPRSRTGTAAEDRPPLLDQAERSVAEIDRRLAEATSQLAGAGASDAEQVAAAVAAAKAVFGPAFVFLPRFRPGNGAALDTSLAASPAIVDTAVRVRQWTAQAARVRPALDRWQLAQHTARALGAPAARFEPVQLPHVPGERWVGMPRAATEEIPAGRLSLVLARAASPTASTDAWSGFVLDEWTETVPYDRETTAVSFHFDSPGTAAPNAVLVAVPPTDQRTWDTATLLDILHETLDLAKLRAVDGELLGRFGQLLPALCLAGNVAADTVATSFVGQLRDEAVHVARKV